MDDDPTQTPETERARMLLAQSETALSEILIAFDLMAERMSGGEEISPTELTKTYTALSQARTRLINEVKEHDKRALRAEGADAAAPLDLEALRFEIGRRLDRIRASQGEADVPRNS